MHRLSNALLFTLVLALAGGDWLVSSTTAQLDEDTPQPPIRVPASAFLTGPAGRAAVAGPFEVALEGAADTGFVLVVHNPTSESRVAAWDVECTQVSGSPISRIAPIPQVVSTERVQVHLAAGATLRHRLEADVAPSPPTDEPRSFLDGFTTTSFQLRRPDASPEAQPLAVLRWSDSPLEAG